VRVYVPATLPLLATWLDAGAAAAPRARAVTPAVREWYSGGDEEELEFSALLDAATDSLGLLAADGAAPRRRLVLAADVPDREVRSLGGPLDEEAPTEVELAGPVPMSAVVSAHCDEPEASEVVAAAAAAVEAARAGDEDASFVVDGAEDGDLLWFDARELRALLSEG